MGLDNAFMSLGRIAGPLWAGFTFDANLSLPYISGAIITAAGFAASWIWLRKTTGEDDTYATTDLAAETQIRIGDATGDW